MIAREEARLRTLFRRLLLLSVATSPLACSTSESPAHGDAGFADDATTGSIDASSSDAGGGDAALAVNDGGVDPYGFFDAACDPSVIDGSIDDAGCDFLERLPCGLPSGSASERCFLALVTCAALCNQSETTQRTCWISECAAVDASTIPEGTPLTLDCQTGVCSPGSSGRRPQGFRDAPPARPGSALGSALASQARLEAASVYAFRRLGAELASMRAPRSLVRAAERSAREEMRHARVISRLARSRGSIPARVTVGRRARARSLEAFALENAVEGCVRESFGALAAMRQARKSPDAELAQAMGPIADDETRHAALAWEIARWVEPRLSAAARVRIRRATEAALGALRCEIESMSPALAGELGLPAGRAGAALVDSFRASLF